jgi:hypothetical protein
MVTRLSRAEAAVPPTRDRPGAVAECACRRALASGFSAPVERDPSWCGRFLVARNFGGRGWSVKMRPVAPPAP